MNIDQKWERFQKKYKASDKLPWRIPRGLKTILKNIYRLERKLWLIEFKKETE